MRVVPAIVSAVSAAAILLLTACSGEAGPTPKRAPQDPGPGALQVKLEALTADACFTEPAEQNPPGCEKYVTQLGSVPGKARQFAGTAHPELKGHGDELEAAITAYRADSCNTEAGTGAVTCSDALVDIAEALSGIETALAAVVDAAGTADTTTTGTTRG
ncbi:hypothetical protein SAMN05216266_115151 [Amycolatopsis marina]|uniref:Secreted protein n=1 Tax=Amycolatopsis marina TaxID=490629 RepID=A0A1I1BTM5_9PSEU|nr:hypothetical protein [Amycolatopsis marina]SFB51790.1 hypothetical protein SAMN05216266_115151 [Amycolatopsis marina]